MTQCHPSWHLTEFTRGRPRPLTCPISVGLDLESAIRRPTLELVAGDHHATSVQARLSTRSGTMRDSTASQAGWVLALGPVSGLVPIDLGRLHVDIYVKKHLRQTPLSSLAGMPAPLAVSSPEATVLDLIAFSDRIGGIRRVTDVIADLKGVINLVGLRAALRAETQTSIKQRLGHDQDLLLSLSMRAISTTPSYRPRWQCAAKRYCTRFISHRLLAILEVAGMPALLQGVREYLDGAIAV